MSGDGEVRVGVMRATSGDSRVTSGATRATSGVVEETPLFPAIDDRVGFEG